MLRRQRTPPHVLASAVVANATSPPRRGLTLSAILSGGQHGFGPSASGDGGPAPVGPRALQLNLPPLFTWGGRDARGGLTESLAAYVDPVLRACRAATSSPQLFSPTGLLQPPSLLLLRLFPDSTVASLSRNQRQQPQWQRGGGGSSSGGEAVILFSGGQAVAAARQARQAHRLPLDAFVEAENPWGGSTDPQAVLREAVATLRAITERFAGTPIVLVLPTRMLVTQAFCDNLVRSIAHANSSGGGGGGGIVGLVFELPSTRVLYEVEGSPGDAMLKRSSTGGAAGPSWARLSLATTPWESLLRCGDRYGDSISRPLRQRLTRHTLLPLHVLLPWVVHAGLLLGGGVGEVGLGVDTTLPRSAGSSEYRRASAEGPDFFALGSAHALRSEQCQQDRFSSGGGGEYFTAFMTDTRLSAAAAQHTPAVHAAATDALRRSQADGARASRGVDLDAVTEAVRDRQRGDGGTHTRASPPPFGSPGSGGGGSGGLLTLDAPPESLRRLIMESVTLDPAAAHAARMAPYQQFGRILAKTFVEDDNGSDGATGRPESTNSNNIDNSSGGSRDSGEEPTMEQELEAMEALLRQSTAAAGGDRSFADLQTQMERELAALQFSGGGYGGSNSSSDAQGEGSSDKDDDMTRQLQKMMRAAQGHEGASDGGSASGNPWDGLRGGYWACLRSLHSSLSGNGSSSGGGGCGGSDGRFSPQLPPAPLSIVTMPTYHAGQVAAWRSSFQRQLRLAAPLPSPDSSSSAAAAVVSGSARLHVLPVTLPELPPTDVEAQRLLREGPRGENHSGNENNDGAVAAASEALSRWLPPDAQAALETSMARLPGAYRRRARAAAVMADYRRCLGTANDDHDNGDSDGPHSATETVSVSADDGAVVRLRAGGRRRRPFWYAAPQQAAAQHAERIAAARRDVVTATAERSRREDDNDDRVGGADDAAARNSRRIPEIEADFKQSTSRRLLASMASMPGYEGSAVALVVPTPGLAEDDLLTSWQDLCRR